MTLDKLSDYNIVFVMMKNKQKLYFSDYYKYKTHAQTNTMLKVSFKTFLKHQLAQQKRQSSVRQRRRRTDAAIFTVNLGAFLN